MKVICKFALLNINELPIVWRQSKRSKQVLVNNNLFAITIGNFPKFLNDFIKCNHTPAAIYGLVMLLRW